MIMPSLTPPPSASSASAERPARRQGCGHLQVSLVDGQSSAILINAQTPLKLLVPTPRGAAVWAFVSTYGGGLVAGDQIALSLRVEANATLAIGTQASTKVYRSDHDLSAAQQLQAVVQSGALLGLLPDPVTCFAGSTYHQRQTIALAEDASLVLIDPLTSGRAARGETWAFNCYDSINHITRAGRCQFHDAIRLHNTSYAPLHQRMGRFQAICNVVLLGPRCRQHAIDLLGWHQAQTLSAHAEFLVSASPLADGAVLRLAATGYELIERFLRLHLGPVAGLFGDQWYRKP
jgi:urease accessory protein